MANLNYLININTYKCRILNGYGMLYYNHVINKTV